MPITLMTFVLSAAATSAMTLSGAADAQPRPNPPRAVVAGSFSEADYPPEALRARAEGTSVVDLVIDSGGRVARCQIVQSAGNGALDTRTCRIFSERFRFAAGSGQSSRRMRISWSLPSTPPPVPFAPSRTMVETLAAANGRNYCQASSVGRPPAALYAIGCGAGAINGPGPRSWQSRRLDAVSLTADGQALHPLPRVRGSVLLQYSLTFDVAPDGRVTRCDVAGADDEDVTAFARQRCDALTNNGAPVFAPASGAAVRHGTIEGLTTFQAR